MLPRLVTCLCTAAALFAAGCCHTAPFCAGPGCVKDTLTCQAGCGELYVDEWLSDPPDPCGDPCDDCGNFVGHGHSGRCDHHLIGLLHKLWGYRYEPSGCGPAASYHGYAPAIAGGPHDDFAFEGDAHGPIAHSPHMGDDFYEVGPGETVVPGSTRITEGDATGEPIPAPTPAPAPSDLPGPSASKSRKHSAGPYPPRPAVHRRTSFGPPPAPSPRQRPRT